VSKALILVAFLIGVAALLGFRRAATRYFGLEGEPYSEDDDGVQPWDPYEVRLWTDLSTR
jgi:hypothetical protein